MKTLRYLILTFLVAAASATLEAQTLPLDFESTTITYSFTDFEGGVVTRIANPQSSGINTSGFVAKMVKNPGAVYAGSLISLAQPIDFSVNKIFKVKVFMPRAGAKMLLKVENATSGAISFEKEATATAANVWEELTFDFSTINTTNSYQKLVFIFDLGTAGDGSSNFTYLFDDIRLVSGGTTLTNPVLPLDFESTSVNYSFTDFEGGVVTRVANPQSSGINTSGFVGKMVKNPGAVYAGSLISLGQPIDFSTNRIFKVKVFMPKVGAKMLLKVENATNGTISFEKEAVGSVANAWEELTFDFNSVNTSNTYQKLVFIFDLGTAGDGGPNFTYLFDDIRLVSGGTTLTSPALPLDFESATVNYAFTDFEGGVSTRIANPQSNGINTSGFVAKMVKNPGAVYAGSLITLAQPIDFSTNKTLKVKVFMPRAGAKMLVKVENLSNGGISFEKEASATAANTWQELTFDFGSINTSNSYQKMVFIFDLGTAGDGSANFTYLFDEIRLVQGGTALSQMKLPVTFDDATVEYGLIGFGGADNSTISTDPKSANNKVAKVIKSSAAELWAGTTVNGPAQLGFSEPVPFTQTEKRMSLRVLSPHAGIKVRLKVEKSSDNTVTAETEATVTTANEWETLVFDFSNVASGTAALNLSAAYNKASVFFNFGVTGAQAGEKTYYFDDLKFGATTGGSTAQQITFGAISDKTLGDAPFTLSATASSGLTVSFSTTSDKISISGTTVTMTKAGRAAIKASQAGNGTFAVAAAVEQSFCIKPAKPTITVTNDDSAEVTLTSSATSGNQWLLNGSPIAGSTGNSITVSDAGNYSLRVQVDDCVSANATDVTLVITGDLRNQNESFKIFPNPASDYLMISGINDPIQDVRIIDPAGRRMPPAKFQINVDGIYLSLSEIPEGLYLLSVRTGKGIYRSRIIKK